MTEDRTAPSATGFQVSDEPVIPTQRPEPEPPASVSSWTTNGLADDSLYILARDPQSLFVYWTLDWAARFAAAELGETQRPVHLRVLRDGEIEERTEQIDALLGFAFVEVSSPEAEYSCEIGCFDGDEWKTLARSSTTQTSAAALSDDLAADFATLPFHLSFQRLLDIFRPTANGNSLSGTVADWQAQARALQAAISPEEWSELVDAASTSDRRNGPLDLPGAQPEEMATLLRTVREQPTWVAPGSEKLEEWRRLGERFGGSSWSGDSSPGNGER